MHQPLMVANLCMTCKPMRLVVCKPMSYKEMAFWHVSQSFTLIDWLRPTRPDPPKLLATLL
jgi:hypothetical protein